MIKTSQEEEEEEEEGEVLLPDHPHRFFLCSKDDEFSDCECDYCLKRLRDPIYVCIDCKLSLHKYCAQLPMKIHHPLHPPHPLSLMTSFDYDLGLDCSFCGSWMCGYCYRCEECKYYLDASCSCFMPIEDNTQGHEGGNLTILRPNHTYPLLVVQDNDSIKSCGACGQRIKDANDPIHFCSKRKIFLHKSCPEVPREIKTPIDPLHPLKLVDQCIRWPPSTFCTTCGDFCENFVYRCSDCEIMLDLKCALSPRPTTLMSLNHHHPLILFSYESSDNPILCSKCQEAYSFPFFRCYFCKLDLHAHCLPKLPTAIKSPYHRHSLTLTYSPVKEWPDESDSVDFYCDNCEEKRNLHEPTYLCEQCHFVAHIGCVLTQVMHGLEEEWSVASKLGNLKYETYADLHEGLLKDIHKKLGSLLIMEARVEMVMEQVRKGRKQLEEARVEEDPLTMSRLLGGRSFESLMGPLPQNLCWHLGELREWLEDMIKEWRQIWLFHELMNKDGDSFA